MAAASTDPTSRLSAPTLPSHVPPLMRLPLCPFAVIFLLVIASSPQNLTAQDSDTPHQETIDFNRDIRPLLFGRCVTCHGPDEEERAADLRLDTVEGACEDLGGYAAVEPGDPEASELILRITSDDEDVVMPPPGKGTPLSADEITLLKRWIAEGGRYAKHWSYEVPARPEVPKVDLERTEHNVDSKPPAGPSWPRNPIDHFTLRRMLQEGLKPSAEADRLTLARRVSIDLTGLPPTWQQAEAFVLDQRKNAYEVYVDTLLSQPSFGERWSRVWLDLARYADSAGYADDPPRVIWAYRDYVIRALNENLPFDQFTIEQIAGDLLPDPTEQQLIATAFHRNTLTNNEGGTNDEEFRNVAVVDRVNTTMAVWMGTTMACAQCHTHKYDPITHDEYFQFFAFFNSTEDADRRNEAPLIELYSSEQRRRRSELTDQITEQERELAAPSEQVDRQRKQWLAGFSHEPVWSPGSAQINASARTFSIDDQGWINAKQDQTAKDTYQLTLPTGESAVTGIKLETSADQQRNFVITQIRANWKPSNPTPIEARFVRVELPGKSKHLHLAEIEVFAEGTNVAPQGEASQSSTYSNAHATRVNDGNTDGDYQKGSVQHTAGDADPWVEIDLGQMRSIDHLVIWNRTDGGDAILARLQGFKIRLLDDDRKELWSQTPSDDPQVKHTATLSGERELTFSQAIADFQQKGFPASAVLSDKADPATGWAVAPRVGKPHQLTLPLAVTIPKVEGKITLSIRQDSDFDNHLLDHFRLSLSDDPNLTRWTDLPAEVRTIVARPKSQWSEHQTQRVTDYFRSIAPALDGPRKRLEAARSELAAIKPMTSVPVMRELPEAKRRETKIQIRGNYLSTGDSVTEGTPEVFHPIDNPERPTRLDLARWLVDPQNPLTARVIVNRHWEQLFGIGLVETSEEFGSQGELPSHPDLLDWLAVEFRESGWDLKQLIKQLVMSATYRQSSVTTAAGIASDPGNRLLARGPRFRVSAEMVRDQALFVSGLLSDKQFGPPVNPPQPSLGLKAAFGSATDWKTSGGEDRYRRGLYTTWRRSSPYPSMAQFDAPNREVCTVRRIRTNTPLQALVTLNDPVYVEASQSLARKIIAESSSDEERIRSAFHRVLIRDPAEHEIQRLVNLVRDTRRVYAKQPDQAMQMATDPLGALPKEADPIEHAAWTVFANVMLNLDEVFMKR